MSERQYLTTTEAAARLDVSPRTVLLWSHALDGFATRVGGRWRIHRSAVDRILAGQELPKKQSEEKGHVSGNPADEPRLL